MAGRIIDVTMQLIDKVTQPLQGVTASLADSNKQWQRAGKDITKTGQSLARTGQALTTAVTMPIVAAGTGAVMTAANFEAGMSKVQSIAGEVSENSLPGIMKQAEAMGLAFEEGSNATETAMNILGAKAQEMGGKTKFSATEAADAFSYMAMAGWKTEQMMSGIEGVMYLAGATETDLAQTSDIVTDAMTAFGMAADGTSKVLKDGVETEVSNVTRFVDVMAATANNANTNVEMLGESFKYVAPVAGSLGYDVEDISAALGLMANSGLKASVAGTSLRSIMTRMAKPTKESQEAMDALGLSLQNEDGTMKSFMEIMEDMREGFPELKIGADELAFGLNDLESAFEAGDITQKQYDAGVEDLMHKAYGAEGALSAEYAAMLAGKTGMAGLLAIVNSSDEDFENLTTAITNSNGACEQMYNIAQDNLMGQLTIIKSSVEALAISFGNTLMPYVKKGAEYVQGLVDKFNSLDETQRMNIVKIAGIAAAIGPVLLIIGKTTIGIGHFVTAVGKIGGAIKAAGGVMAALTGPGAIVVAVLAAIAVAAVLVITHWDQVKAAAQTLWDSIQPIVQHLQDKWKELSTYIKTAWETNIKPAWDNFSSKVSEVWTLVQPLLTNFGNLMKDIFEVRFKFAIDVAVAVFKFLFDNIQAVVTTLLGVFSGIIDFVVGVFTGDWDRAWNGIAQIFSSVWDGMKQVADSAVQFIGGLVDGLVNAWNGLLTLIGKAKDESKSVPSAGSSGNFNAVGTSYFKGGTTWVHERGAEIIDLPRGSRIYPHAESLKMAYNEGRASGGGGKGNITITVAKLAENIQVRSDSDIEAIAAALANKLEQTAQNIGGGELGYIY